MTKAELRKRALASVRRGVKRARWRQKNRGTKRGAEHRAEALERVRQNVPPELLPYFEKVKGSLGKGTPHERFERFMHLAHEHEGDAAAALYAEAEAKFEAELAARLEDPATDFPFGANAPEKPRKPMAAKKAKKKAKRKAAKKPAAARKPARKPKAAKKPKKKSAKVKRPGDHTRTRAAACKPKKNPGRPPKKGKKPPASWRAMLASFDKHHPKVSRRVATANRAYWKTPRKARIAHVRGLIRRGQLGDARAVLVAEARHARPPPGRKTNPASDVEAEEHYRELHWGDEGRGRITESEAADPRRGTLTQLGRLHSVVYVTSKGGEDAEWEHTFAEGGGRRPHLLVERDSGKLVIAGGTYTVKKAGIVG